MNYEYWFQVLTGTAWDYENPKASDIELKYIAWSLARQARFYGHTKTEIVYSVGHHSVLAAWRVEELLTSPKYEGIPERQWGAIDLTENWAMAALGGLLHDSAETWLGDWASPLKALLRAHGCGEVLDSLERYHNQAVAEWAALPSGDWLSLPVIKRADLELLATESRDAMAPAERTWKPNPFPALPRRIEPWDWRKSRDVFADEFHRLRRAAGLHWTCVTGAGYAVEGLEE